MKRAITFELCAETLQACFVAKEGGANRIELCSALSEDGLTPSHGLIRAAVEHSGLPIHVLLRPRSGNFLYSDEEFALMQDDLQHARSLGAKGFALGILLPDATIDVERTRKLVELASPLEVTFHRAFDLVPSLNQALEDVIASGCGRVLTSGGERDVVTGAVKLANLVEQAGDRVDVAVGGGLRITNAATIAQITGATHFHGSVRIPEPVSQHERSGILDVRDRFIVRAEDIRAMARELAQS
ncbi:MAG TPA: copper homeostasis protein CutC [Edaphobacter sp.]